MSRVAVVQMVSTVDVEANLKQAQALLEQAADAGARLALLPENFALFDSVSVLALAEAELESRVLESWLAEQARHLGLWVIAGSLPAVDRPDGSRVPDGRVRSRMLVFNDQGEVVARYDKRHLFDVDVGDAQSRYRESDRFEPGDEVLVVDSPLGVLGLSVCYDLRFPLHYQRLRELGAELLLVPSAFTAVTGKAHWEVLLRARAIETQCYCLGADQGGWHSRTRETWGHSMVVDPWGEVMASHVQGAGLALADIDLKALHKLRSQMPVWQHRRDRC
ncbi:carbon-nitrogen hydrolase family protein [Marinobacterium sp. YM272]|uniref:carbon-nitrogen hydrolase family protein n=1 Tax=Marinobacterium sp. YM272 TaxID=3421654 RepID=UPI003D7FA489